MPPPRIHLFLKPTPLAEGLLVPGMQVAWPNPFSPNGLQVGRLAGPPVLYDRLGPGLHHPAMWPTSDGLWDVGHFAPDDLVLALAVNEQVDPATYLLLLLHLDLEDHLESIPMIPGLFNAQVLADALEKCELVKRLPPPGGEVEAPLHPADLPYGTPVVHRSRQHHGEPLRGLLHRGETCMNPDAPGCRACGRNCEEIGEAWWIVLTENDEGQDVRQPWFDEKDQPQWTVDTRQPLGRAAVEWAKSQAGGATR